MLLQRKNDKREANSRSLIRYAAPADTVAGSCSMRNRNSEIRIQKLTVGYAPQEKKRQTGGKFEIADSIRGSRRHSRRIVFDAEQKLRDPNTEADCRVCSSREKTTNGRQIRDR